MYYTLAEKYNLKATLTTRSLHKKPTVVGIGILFVIAIFYFFFTNSYQFPYLTGAIALIASISLLDDFFKLSAFFRIFIHVIVTVLVFYQLFNGIHLNALFIVFLLLGIGSVNTYNFMDGVNGMLGFNAIITIATFLTINYFETLVPQNLLVYVLVALLVFGFFNFRKHALAFSGDVGSTVMGIFVFFLMLLFSFKLNALIFLAMILVFFIDTFCTFCYRLFVTKENLFLAHKHHLYEKSVETLGVSHLKIAFIYAFLQLVINCIVYYSYKLSTEYQVLILLGISSLGVLGYFYFFQKLKKLHL